VVVATRAAAAGACEGSGASESGALPDGAAPRVVAVLAAAADFVAGADGAAVGAPTGTAALSAWSPRTATVRILRGSLLGSVPLVGVGLLVVLCGVGFYVGYLRSYQEMEAVTEMLRQLLEGALWRPKT